MTMEQLDLLPTVELEPAGAQLHVNQVVELWIRSHASKGTQRAYQSALRCFAEGMGTTPNTAAQALLQGKREATALVLAWRAALQEKGRAPNTINSRVAALRSFVRFASSLGIVDYALEVSNVKSRPYRDTRGPGRRGFQDLLKSTKDARDRAILWLLYGCALRCAEVTSLDIGDVDLDGASLAIMGKGHTEKTTITIPAPVSSALRSWIDERGVDAGPLFTNRDRANKGSGRLGNRSVRRLMRRLGSYCGVSTSPHGLRHTAITEALDATSGDLRAVQRFSRHVDVRTLQIYDDSREDLGGKVAALVAGAADLDG